MKQIWTAFGAMLLMTMGVAQTTTGAEQLQSVIDHEQNVAA